LSRGDLSEAEWRLLKDLLPAERGRKSRPAHDNRTIVNGILWRLRTGAPWRDVPEKYGKWMTVYQRFRRWSRAGVWEAVASRLAEAMADNARHSIDSTTVRGHVSAAGAKGGLANKLLAARGAGSPVKFIVSVMPEASRSSSISRPARRRTARHSIDVIALAEERPAYLLADKGYDSDAIRTRLHEAGIRSCIPPKSNRKAKIRWNRRIY
jgi:transposase